MTMHRQRYRALYFSELQPKGRTSFFTISTTPRVGKSAEHMLLFCIEWGFPQRTYVCIRTQVWW